MKNFIIMGAPGAGKGTQAERIVGQFGSIHVSTGDMFREAMKNETDLGKLAKSYMDKGEFVPDSVTNLLVKERLGQMDIAKHGFLLDGFPRNINQAKELKQILDSLELKVDFVINIDVPSEILVTRIIGRRICKTCGKNFHIEFSPSKAEGTCDFCKGPLYQRDDDNEETVKNRLELYLSQTKPLLNYYHKEGLLFNINGNANVNTVFDIIQKTIATND